MSTSLLLPLVPRLIESPTHTIHEIAAAAPLLYRPSDPSACSALSSHPHIRYPQHLCPPRLHTPLSPHYHTHITQRPFITSAAIPCRAAGRLPTDGCPDRSGISLLSTGSASRLKETPPLTMVPQMVVAPDRGRRRCR